MVSPCAHFSISSICLHQSNTLSKQGCRFLLDQVDDASAAFCHAKMPETFLNAATDHSLVSRNSGFQNHIARSGGLKNHESCFQTSRSYNSRAHRLAALLFLRWLRSKKAPSVETTVLARGVTSKGERAFRWATVKEQERNAFSSVQH